MYQVIFGLFLVLIATACVFAHSAIVNNRAVAQKDRQMWIKDHIFEIIDTFAKRNIIVFVHDKTGRKLVAVASNEACGYSIRNMETGQQTRVLNVTEFYDLMRKAEGTVAEDTNKLLFGKYLYRQFNVK